MITRPNYGKNARCSPLPHPNFLQTPRAEELSVEPQGLAFRTLTGDLLATLGVVGRPQIGEKLSFRGVVFYHKQLVPPEKRSYTIENYSHFEILGMVKCKNAGPQEFAGWIFFTKINW